MAYKPLANTVDLASATNLFNATDFVVTTAGSACTVTIANTAISTVDNAGQHGSYAGGQVSIRIPINVTVALSKRPKDTVVAIAGVYGTKVAAGGS